jgi:3-oxoacyl-[acyl-carrier-protein] synthase I
MRPVAILRSGIVSGVGLNAASTCAAIRCAIDRFEETRFLDAAGEWIVGSYVESPRPFRDVERLIQLVALAIRECLAGCEVSPQSIPLLLCVAERSRAGRFVDLDQELYQGLVERLGTRFHPASALIPKGRVAGALGLIMASQLLHDQRVPMCLVAGVDSLLIAETLSSYEERGRLLTTDNSNGFIPGEAAAAVLLGIPGQGTELVCQGWGAGRERATIESEEPFRADGMTQAFRAAIADSGMTFKDLDYRLADLNGEQYGFKEATLAFTRTSRNVKPSFELWHPADCIGEVGAAIGPCIFGVALAASQKGYAPGSNVLCHFAADDDERVALILSYGARTVG